MLIMIVLNVPIIWTGWGYLCQRFYSFVQFANCFDPSIIPLASWYHCWLQSEFIILSIWLFIMETVVLKGWFLIRCQKLLRHWRFLIIIHWITCLDVGFMFHIVHDVIKISQFILKLEKISILFMINALTPDGHKVLPRLHVHILIGILV